MALRAAADVERSLHLEERAIVVDRAQLDGIDVEPAHAVGDDGIVRPAVPQALDDVKEFARHLVAAGVVGMGDAEIGGGRGICRRHCIPSGAAVADVIERSEHARDRERIAVGGGDGRT